MWGDPHKFIHSGNCTILEIFKNKDRIPITPGLLLMSAYLQFVFPRESEVAEYSAYALDVSIFKIHKWDKDKQDAELGQSAIFRRIRNSIAHARVTFASEHAIMLVDGKPQKNAPFKEEFKAEVKMVDFGNFLESIMLKWMQENVEQ